MIRAFFVALTLLATVAGCHPKPPGAAREQGPIAPAEFSGHGVRFAFPTGWERAPDVENKELVAVLVPANAGRDADSPAVSLDVPKLPPHVPGFIPLGLVVNGYVDDLKKLHAGVIVREPVSVKVSGANGRRVRSTWDVNGRTHVEDAVLTVHGDRVYIFRASAAATEEAVARAALDQVLDAVRWE